MARGLVCVMWGVLPTLVGIIYRRRLLADTVGCGGKGFVGPRVGEEETTGFTNQNNVIGPECP